MESALIFQSIPKRGMTPLANQALEILFDLFLSPPNDANLFKESEKRVRAGANLIQLDPQSGLM